MIAEGPVTDELVPGLPKPKYGVGDTFWVAGVESKTSQLSCPDCLGSRTWKATSPAGVEHELACPRCGNGYSATSIGGDRLPSLSYVEHVAVARRFTVGGIEVRSHDWSDEPGGRITYYSNPQGGSTYRENQAYDSEETALTVARLQAAEANAKVQASAEHLEKTRFAALTLRDAVLSAAHQSAYEAWWAYVHLKEDVESAVENGDVKDLCEELKRHLDFDRRHRQQYREALPPVAPLYTALKEVLTTFEDVTDEQLAWLLPEEVAKRAKEAVATLVAARAAARRFVEEAR